MTKSKLGRLNLHDLYSSLITLIISTFLSSVLFYLTDPKCGNISCIDWNFVIKTVLVAVLSTILKKIGTNSNGKLLKKEE